MNEPLEIVREVWESYLAAVSVLDSARDAYDDPVPPAVDVCTSITGYMQMLLVEGHATMMRVERFNENDECQRTGLPKGFGSFLNDDPQRRVILDTLHANMSVKLALAGHNIETILGLVCDAVERAAVPSADAFSACGVDLTLAIPSESRLEWAKVSPNAEFVRWNVQYSAAFAAMILLTIY